MNKEQDREFELLTLKLQKEALLGHTVVQHFQWVCKKIDELESRGQTRPLELDLTPSEVKSVAKHQHTKGEKRTKKGVWPQRIQTFLLENKAKHSYKEMQEGIIKRFKLVGEEKNTLKALYVNLGSDKIDAVGAVKDIVNGEVVFSHKKHNLMQIKSPS